MRKKEKKKKDSEQVESIVVQRYRYLIVYHFKKKVEKPEGKQCCETGHGNITATGPYILTSEQVFKMRDQIQEEYGFETVIILNVIRLEPVSQPE